MPFFREKTGGWSPEKIGAFLIATIPLLWLLGLAFTGNLGVQPAGKPTALSGELAGRPVHDAILFTGRWTVRLILLTLAITPARRLFNWPKLVNARRTLGVAAACYAALHFTLYVTDQKFELDVVVSEIVLRFYLTIGFIALLSLIALASTSTDAAVRRLGAKWTTLHRLVYLASVLAIVHFALQKKLDIYEPTLMMGFLFWLLGWRLLRRFRLDGGLIALVALSIVAALLTAVFEAGWYGTLTGVSPARVLNANLMFELMIRPAWWVLAAGIGVSVASRFTQSIWPRSARAGGPNKERGRAKLTPAE